MVRPQVKGLRRQKSEDDAKGRKRSRDISPKATSSGLPKVSSGEVGLASVPEVRHQLARIDGKNYPITKCSAWRWSTSGKVQEYLCHFAMWIKSGMLVNSLMKNNSHPRVDYLACDPFAPTIRQLENQKQEVDEVSYECTYCLKRFTGKSYKRNCRRHVMGIIDKNGDYGPGRAPCMLFGAKYAEFLNAGHKATDFTIADVRKVMYIDPPENGVGEKVDDDDGNDEAEPTPDANGKEITHVKNVDYDVSDDDELDNEDDEDWNSGLAVIQRKDLLKQNLTVWVWIYNEGHTQKRSCRVVLGFKAACKGGPWIPMTSDDPMGPHNSATEFIAPREMEKVPGVTLLGGPIVMLPAALEKDRIIKRKKGTEASYDEVDGYKGNISDGVRDNKSKRKPLLEEPSISDEMLTLKKKKERGTDGANRVKHVPEKPAGNSSKPGVVSASRRTSPPPPPSRASRSGTKAKGNASPRLDDPLQNKATIKKADGTKQKPLEPDSTTPRKLTSGSEVFTDAISSKPAKGTKSAARNKNALEDRDKQEKKDPPPSSSESQIEVTDWNSIM